MALAVNTRALPASTGARLHMLVSCAFRRFNHHAAPPHRRASHQCQASGTREKVQNLPTEFCDDFECTSSPAVEATIRAFARDVVRGQRLSQNLFQKDVQYAGLRSFSGKERYERHLWVKEIFGAASVSVTKMEMVGLSTAKVGWRVAGDAGAGDMELELETLLELNPITGLITSQKDSVRVSKGGPAAAAAFAARSRLWAAQQGSQDAQEGLKKVAETLDSMTSLDGGKATYRDPTDPTKFFQQDDGNKDLLQLATVAAFSYLAYRAFGEIMTLH